MSIPDERTDLYGVLEVSASATFEEIEAAYARIQETLGGNGLALYSIIEDEDTGSWADLIDTAYRTLTDPDRRSAYDRHLRGESEYPSITVNAPDSEFTDTARDHEFPDTTRNHAEPSSPDTQPPPPTESVAAAPPGRPKPRRLQPSLDIEITSDTEFSGSLLCRLRESAGASLAQVAEITKIGKGYLRAIESNDFDALPAPVYVRGFVVEYAKVLGLDSEQVAKSFMVLYRRYREGGR